MMLFFFLQAIKIGLETFSFSKVDNCLFQSTNPEDTYRRGNVLQMSSHRGSLLVIEMPEVGIYKRKQ